MKNLLCLLRHPFATVLAVAAIILAGTLLRAANIKDVGTPGDELEVERICNMGSSSWAILRGDVKGSIGNFLPAMVKFVGERTGAGVNRITMRVPGLILAAVSMLLMFYCGRLVAGTSAGLLACALLALNANHIQCTREVYPYIVGVSGATVVLWALLSSSAHEGHGHKRKAAWLGALLVGSFLMMNASLSTYPVAVVLAALFGLEQLLIARKRPSYFWTVALTLGVLLIALGPRLFQQLKHVLEQGSAKHGRADAYGNLPLFDPMGLQFVTRFSWGHGVFAILLLLLCLLGLFVGIKRLQRPRCLIVVIAFMACGFFATMVGRYFSGNPFYPRFLSPILSAYVLLLACLLEALRRWIFSRAKLPVPWRTPLSVLPIVLAVVLSIQPSLLASRMLGHPTPFAQIVEWADANLPEGTPVLCDRYFDAFNEFVFNPPKHVFFMSTIPNEPLQRYRETKWRDSAQSFFNNNPDAAFYETKMYWMQNGPWEWPHEYFANKKVFVDEHFLTLRKMGMNYRQAGGNAYPEEWIPKTIYYNTIDDLKARAQREKRPVLALFGSGWVYTKTQDMSDWRVLQKEAYVDVHNVTAAPVDISLSLLGIAPGKSKTVEVDGKTITFPADKPVSAAIARMSVPPGHTHLKVSDAGWETGKVPFFTRQVVVKILEKE